MTITIVDYGMGNMRSLEYKLSQAHFSIKCANSVKDLRNAEILILPGVGNFSKAMKNLQALGLIGILKQKIIEEKIPTIGICLGFQLFSEYSEEGNCQGLGYLKAKTVKFNPARFENPLPIPHVGWQSLNIKKDKYLFKEIPETHKFYFTHSYHVICSNSSDIIATTHYGYEFVAAAGRENILGVQFHPEKSHKTGFKLLINWLKSF